MRYTAIILSLLLGAIFTFPAFGKIKSEEPLAVVVKKKNKKSLKAKMQKAVNFHISQAKKQNTFLSKLSVKALSLVNKALAGDSVVVAIILWFFLGGLAIHRVYLGTTPLMILWYFLTFGGIFGLCPLFDLITMIVDFDAMIDNNKFFSIAAL